MAGTLTISLNMSVVGTSPNVFAADSNVSPVEITLTNGWGGGPGYVAFTTSEADISFGSMSGKMYVLIWNTGDTNSIQIGPKSGGAMVQEQLIGPGQFAVICLASGVTLRGRTDAGTTSGIIRAFN